MKKKVLLIFIALMGVAMLATPFVQAKMPEPKGQKVAVTETSKSITYTALSAALKPGPNPYPAPPMQESWYRPGNVTADANTFHRDGGSAYFNITDLNIGGVHYTGISVNTYDGFRNIDAGIVHHHYDAIWYIGALGDLSSGFAGNMELVITGYLTPETDWYVMHCVFHGFGDFDGQTLTFTLDGPSTNVVWNGYCLKG